MTIAIAGVAGLLASVAVGAPPTAPPCTLEPGPMRTVARVVDGETIVLDDGSAVRLIGALAPRARDAGASAGAWPPESEAIAALSELVLGKRVQLAFGGRRKDRYGRLLAQVFVGATGASMRGDWVQGEMLASGHARAYGLPESFVCARELLAHETQAREKRLGIWNNGVYRLKRAEPPGALMASRGKYERVSGVVVSVGRTRGATYLNFGSDWHSDFTARIDKSVLAANADFDHGLDKLAGKTITVRGWIERRGGPLIEITDPSQLEGIEASDDPGAVARGTGTGGTQPASAPGDAARPSIAPNEGSPKEVRPAPPEGAEPGAVNL